MTTGRIPTRIAVRSGLVLVSATALAMAGAAILAITYQATTNEVGVPFGSGSLGFGRVRFADRLAMFVDGRTNLIWALMLALAMVVLAQSSATDEQEGSGVTVRRMLVASAVLAWVIVVADLVMCIMLAAGVERLVFAGAGSGSDRVGTIVELLGPALLAAGALGYARRQLATEPGETETEPV